jgi:hypothetical protein
MFTLESISRRMNWQDDQAKMIVTFILTVSPTDSCAQFHGRKGC